MSKKLMSTMMAVVLAVGLMPAPAFAGGAQGSATGSSQSASIQVQSKGRSAAKLQKATETMHSCYKKVLKQGRNGTGKFKAVYSKAGSSKNSWGARYTMHDINNDGTPELFIHAGSYNLNTEWYAYTVKSGKAKFLGKFGTGQMSLGVGTGNKLYGTHAHMNSLAVALVKLKKGKIKSTWKFEVNATTREDYDKLTAYTQKKGIEPLSSLLATDLSALNNSRVTK